MNLIKSFKHYLINRWNWMVSSNLCYAWRGAKINKVDQMDFVSRMYESLKIHE